jgi:serine/threonine protein kinase
MTPFGGFRPGLRESRTATSWADATRYQQRIGEGGAGVVVAAYDRREDRAAAVKVVRGGGEHDTARIDQYLRRRGTSHDH